MLVPVRQLDAAGADRLVTLDNVFVQAEPALLPPPGYADYPSSKATNLSGLTDGSGGAQAAPMKAVEMNSNLDVVRNLYRAFAVGDIPSVPAMLSPPLRGLG